LNISQFSKDDGPEVWVWYKNTNKIKDLSNNDIKKNTWGFTHLKRKEASTSKFKVKTIDSLGVLSNIAVISSMTLTTITSAITMKSMMPAIITFLSYQKLYTLTIIETVDDYFWWFLFYFKYTYIENMWVTMGGDEFGNLNDQK